MKLGVDPDSRFRIKSGIKYILSHAASNGHTYLPESMVEAEHSRFARDSGSGYRVTH